MKQKAESDNLEGKESTRLENYKLAIKDAQHIFTTYKNSHPAEAWECLRKIIFNPTLK